MKEEKLNLTSLKVKSFVTDLDKETVETVKGGAITIGICAIPTNFICLETIRCYTTEFPISRGGGGISVCCEK